MLHLQRLVTRSRCYRSLFALLCLGFIAACGGNEGVSEGMMGGVPFRFTDKNVKAIQGIPSGFASPYANYAMYPGALPPQALTIMIGDDLGAKNFRQRLTIYVYDVLAVFDNPDVQVPFLANGVFEYMSGGEIQTVQATTGMIYFNRIGYLSGERVDAQYELYFGAEGSVSGNFRTRIGLTR